LLTVIAIIAVLAAILIPAISKVRENSVMAASVSNQRQLGLAALQYAQDNKGKLPASVPGGLHWCRGAIHEFLTGRVASPEWDDMDAAFLSPAVDYESDPDLTQQNATFGFNAHLAGDPAGGDKGYDNKEEGALLMTITRPTEAAMLVDFPVPNFNNGQLGQASKIEGMTSRFGGTINIFYVDGHMGTMTVDEILAISGGKATSRSGGRAFFYGRY